MGPGSTTRLLRRSARLWPLLAVAGVVLAVYLLVPFVLRGFRFPVGPDASVYLWWLGFVREEGLSVLGNRAGLPAVALVLSEALGVSSVTLLAALQCAVAAVIGLTASALVGGSEDRPGRRTVLAGLLAGLFAAHVAAGYFSALAFAALFLGAVACLCIGTRRPAVLAGAMLVATGLTHPELASLGILIVLVWAALAVRAGERPEALRLGGALAGAVAGAALGGVALAAGPPPLSVDTSRDLFLIRAEMSGLLRRLYARRILLHLWSYAPYALVPLAAVGLTDVDGSVRRAMSAWLLVTGAAVTVGALTGWFPPERAVSVAFVLPILAAFGIDRLLRRRAPVASATALTGLVAVVAVAGWTWWHTVPATYEIEAARASEAARYAAAAPARTPLVFEVSGPQPVLTFLATRAANELRAAMPPDRIRDVFVVVPPPPDGADPERTALWSMLEADVDDAVARSGRDPIIFRLNAFIRAPFPDPPGGLPPPVAHGLTVRGAVPDPVERSMVWLAPTSLIAILAAAGAVLTILGLVGGGWTQAVLRRDPRAVPLAPAVGLAALTLSAIALERLGVALERPVGALVVLSVATLPGWIVSKVRPLADAP